MVENIRYLCEKAGITINQLEKATGLGRGTIYRWDEKKPGIDKAKAVADYFDVTLDEIYGDKKIETDDEVMLLREQLRRRPEIKMLFSVSEKATKEQILAVAEMIDKWATKS